MGYHDAADVLGATLAQCHSLTVDHIFGYHSRQILCTIVPSTASLSVLLVDKSLMALIRPMNGNR